MRYQVWAVALLFAVALQGCATSRGVVDIQVPPTVNPASGPAVKIMAVNDRRVFEIKPRRPSIPSLKNAEINDPSITTRAIARKRNGYGKALGDILLPEQRSVAQLTAETLAGALQRVGYRVVGPNDPDYASAAPIEADVFQFWAWMTPGMWRISIEFEAIVGLRGALASLPQPVQVRGYHILKTSSGAGKAWVQAIEQGISDLKTHMAQALSGPPVMVPPPGVAPPAPVSGGEVLPTTH